MARAATGAGKVANPAGAASSPKAVLREEAVSTPTPALSPAARHQRLIEWNDSAGPATPAVSFPDLFSRQVARAPHAVAVTVGGESLSYGELDLRAGRLARYLRRLGVGAESAVGICLPRSVEMVVAVLAVVQAGGAYLPIEPRHPPARRAALLADSGARLLLTLDPAALPPPGFAGRVLGLAAAERTAARLALGAPTAAPVPIDPENLLYILYTSGSTGRPKGVMVSHRSLVHHAAAMVRRYPLSATDRVFQLAALSFDVAAEEIFATWLAGATLVLAHAHALDSPAELVAEIERERVTVCGLTASYWHALVAELAAGDLRPPTALRRLIVGAEVVSAERLAAWRRVVGEAVAVANAYGPTEATVQATLHEPRTGRESGGSSVPIGRPLPDVRVYLLDEAGEPVPAGASGEIHLGGPGLARGYLGRPEATAERFRPDPFGGEPGARLYRTGDLARHLPDGEIEFLGRRDEQIKVRGHRVEPGEIEAALLEHPDIAEAVVIAREHPDPAEWTIRGLARLTPEDADRLLATVERIPPELPEPAGRRGGRTRSFERRTRHFGLSLTLGDDGFVATPAPHQRSWLLHQLLDETTAELDHLDRIAASLVPSSERPAIERSWRESAARYDGRQLEIAGQQVMQDWERPLMRAMAEVVGASHGDVLEVGFGMGISATYLQELGVRSHTVVECNDAVLREAERWRGRYPDRDIRLIRGRWEEVAHLLGTYDGVFFDTYHNDEKEYAEHVLGGVTYAEHFFPTAAACLRRGGVFSYYSNEIDSMSRRHQRRVLDYFRSLELSVVRPLSPPADCNYWWADSMVVVKAVK